MASPDLELQGSIVARLKSFSMLTALVADRIYDQPPSSVSYPYISLGESDVQRSDGVGLNSCDVYLTIHAWSSSPGYPEVKRVADAVAEALHLFPLPISSNQLISINHRQTRVFRDQDGITSHAVIEFLAFVQKP